MVMERGKLSVHQRNAGLMGALRSSMSELPVKVSGCLLEVHVCYAYTKLLTHRCIRAVFTSHNIQ